MKSVIRASGRIGKSVPIKVLFGMALIVLVLARGETAGGAVANANITIHCFNPAGGDIQNVDVFVYRNGALQDEGRTGTNGKNSPIKVSNISGKIEIVAERVRLDTGGNSHNSNDYHIQRITLTNPKFNKTDIEFEFPMERCRTELNGSFFVYDTNNCNTGVADADDTTISGYGATKHGANAGSGKYTFTGVTAGRTYDLTALKGVCSYTYHQFLSTRDDDFSFGFPLAL